MNLRSVSMTAVALSALIAVGGKDVDAQVRPAPFSSQTGTTLPPPEGAGGLATIASIAFAADADTTQSRAAAWFGDITLSPE